MMEEKTDSDSGWGIDEDWNDPSLLTSMEGKENSDASDEGDDEWDYQELLDNSEKEALSSASSQKVMEEWDCLELSDGGKREPAFKESCLLPAAISRIVAEYFSDSNSEHVQVALTGVQPITLCLSQDITFELADCWNLGFLPPKHQLGLFNPKIDKEFEIEDFERCRSLLSEKTPHFGHFAVEVLVVKLNLSPWSRNVLVSLRSAVTALREHLNNVKYVVISVSKNASCCFSLQDYIEQPSGLSPPVDTLEMLLQIIVDLDTCVMMNQRLTIYDLFTFYFESEIKPPSEKYLLKMVLTFDYLGHSVIFKKQTTKRVTEKIMWFCIPQSFNTTDNEANAATFPCHALQMDATDLSDDRIDVLNNAYSFSKRVISLQNNPIIERIAIRSSTVIRQLILPKPKPPLVDSTLHSALKEITLEGSALKIHQTQLNQKGYFPNLKHLSVRGGNITGHLNSDCVPQLKTLYLEVGGRFPLEDDTLESRLRRHTRSLINAGRPWQLVASQKPGGWALASYDDPLADPPEEAKENLLQFCPFIRELLLFMRTLDNANEWKSQINGNPAMESLAKDHTDRIVRWAPDRVEKITAFGTSEKNCHLEIFWKIPGETRNLHSLMCDNIAVELSGDVLPLLASLEVSDGMVVLEDTFPLLKSLSLKDVDLSSEWVLGAPLLESFKCDNVSFTAAPLLDLPKLSRLSSLQINSISVACTTFPEILFDEDDTVGLSRINHVVIGNALTLSPFLEQCRLNLVSQLELTVNALQLPNCWHTTEWQCETLTINIDMYSHDRLSPGVFSNVAVFPSLPRVKKLTITANHSQVLLDKAMNELTECTLPSPSALGPNLQCPFLKRIRYTDELTESDREKCLDRATYEAIGARPRDVVFAFHYQIHTMDWNVAPKESSVLSWLVLW